MLQRAARSSWFFGAQLGLTDSASVEVCGETTPDFVPMRSILGRIVSQYAGGAALAVYHRGELVADLWAGDRAPGQAWQRGTLSPSFSTTKGVAATAIHVLRDRRLIDYDARVADYWPGFARNGKGDIRVRHLLSHQAGLFHIRSMIDRADRMLDWEYMVRALEQAEPQHGPGERTGYHGLTFGFLVGELVQRITRQSFSEFVAREIAAPLELDGCEIGASEPAIARAARLMRTPSVWQSLRQLRPVGRTQRADRIAIQSFVTLLRLTQRGLNLGGVPIDVESVLEALAPRGITELDFSAPDTLRACIPAANGVFTARSLAKLYALLAAGGELDGVRLLSTATLLEATRRQPRTAKLHVIPFDMRWRLGYHGVLTTRGFLPHAFGHFGLGGSGAWACPEHQLAVALTVNSGIGSPFGDLRIIRAGSQALSCARGRHAWADAASLD